MSGADPGIFDDLLDSVPHFRHDGLGRACCTANKRNLEKPWCCTAMTQSASLIIPCSVVDAFVEYSLGLVDERLHDPRCPSGIEDQLINIYRTVWPWHISCTHRLWIPTATGLKRG